MRKERLDEFLVLQGLLSTHGVLSSDPAFDTLSQLESTMGSMTSEQLRLIGKLIAEVVAVRNREVKRDIISSLENLKI